MKADLSVIDCGTTIEIGPEDSPVEGVIAAINVRGRNVSYEVVWWDGRTRKSEWLGHDEVRVAEGVTSRPLGFHFRVD